MSEQQEGMEGMEALYKAPPKGDQGVKGEQGERGEPGASRLPSGQARAIVYLFVLCIALFLVLGAGLLHYVHKFAADQHTQEVNFQRGISQSDAHQARIRCQAIAQIVSIPVPAPVAGNPSRVWEATYEHVQRQRGIAAGCKMPPLATIAVKHH